MRFGDVPPLLFEILWVACCADFHQHLNVLNWIRIHVCVLLLFAMVVCFAAGMEKLLPGTPEERDAAMKERIPLQRMGRKWDIAMASVFLCSPAAAYITGVPSLEAKYLRSTPCILYTSSSCRTLQKFFAANVPQR